MKDKDKTQKQPTKESTKLRHRSAELEQPKIERKRAEEALRESEEQLRLKPDSILLPETDSGEQGLANIIDIPSIQTTVDEFYKLVGMGVWILDLKGTVLVGVGWQDICTKYHRIQPQTAQNCIESDLYLSRNMRPGEIVAYKCKNGMTDVVTPLHIGGKHIGNIYTGQFFYNDEDVDVGYFAAQAAQYGFEKEPYLEALQRVPRVDRASVRTLMDFLVKFTTLVSKMGYGNLNLTKAIHDQKQVEEELRKHRDHLEESVKEHTAELELEITVRKRAEEELGSQTAILNAVNRVLREAIACEREEQLGRACLAVAEELTGSKFGFIDELNAAGKADNIAISDPGWEVCRMPKSNAVVLLKNLEVRGIWASVIRQGCSLIVNDPPNHPDSVGTPPGHPPITSFLGVPLKQAGKTIGLIGLANKGAGYTPADQEAVEALSVAFVEALIRNRAEQALRSANAYNRSLLEASLDPLVTIGRDGRITDVNAATEKVTGCSRQDLVGNDFSDYFTEPEKARKGYQQVFQEGYVKDYPLEIRHKDGRINSVLYNASVYRDEKGEVSGVFAAARDITERKRMEDMLRESEERYRTVANFTYDWEYWRSSDGKLLYISPSCERITGYCAEEFLAKPDLMDAIVHPDDHFLFEQHTFLVQHSGTEQKVHEVDFRILRRDGEIRWIAHACQIIRRSDGTSLGRRATNRDITERKQAEEEVRKLNVELEQRVRDRTVQLEATNKELEAFSYSVSHDLRAPLRAIDGFSRLMLEDYAEKLDDEGKRYLGVIRDNTHKMGQLIDDLLTLSRLGRKEINVSNIDMARLAKAVFNETKLDAPERKVKCTIKKLPDACGDQAMIRQVFANLLSNATKFTKPTDVAIIEIGCSNGENENVYCVKDNGVGFDMQYADKLFGVFQRLHSSEEFEGTGVGLALVQRIIFRHGGRVWAEGKVNGGACFYFTLPRERKE